MLLVLRLLWTMWPTSLSRRQWCSTSLAPTRKASIAHPLCPPSLVCTPPTCTSTVVKSMTGAHAVTLRTHPCVMVSASGSLPAWDQLPSMLPSQATTSSATARWAQMLLSAMAPIRASSAGYTSSTVVSGAWTVSPVSGYASPTGCSPSTSEHLTILSFCCLINFSVPIPNTSYLETATPYLN